MLIVPAVCRESASRGDAESWEDAAEVGKSREETLVLSQSSGGAWRHNHATSLGLTTRARILSFFNGRTALAIE